jgi:hypothetical protein
MSPPSIEYADLLLGELAGALVLAVAQEFDDAALIGGEAVRPSVRTTFQSIACEPPAWTVKEKKHTQQPP